MSLHPSKKARVRKELEKAGVTGYGLMKAESRYLANIIHDDEKIEAVAYGRMSRGSAMLIATDKRVIFLDKKPMLITTEELTYDIVSGINGSFEAGFASVTLRTRNGDYMLRFVNQVVARNFMNYIEKRRIEITVQMSGAVSENTTQTPPPNQPAQTAEQIEPATPETPQNNDTSQLHESLHYVSFAGPAETFLRNNKLGVLSTISREGKPHSAVVYFELFNDLLFFVTKSETAKIHNILANKSVCATIYNEIEMTTLNIEGIAGFETDNNIRKHIFDSVVQEKSYLSGKHYPPVTKINDGKYTVIRISPTDIDLRNYEDNRPA